jgi:hypothetical protein
MKRLLFLLLICFAETTFAQNFNFYGVFPMYSQTGSIDKRWLYNLTATATFLNEQQMVEQKMKPASDLQYYFQPSISYKVNPQFNIGLGYAFVKHDIFGLYENENRAFVQGTYTHFAGEKGKMTHRLRIEERFPLNLKTQLWSYATLVRYQIGFSLPLYNTKRTNRGFYLAANNEFFFYLKGAENGPVSAKNTLYAEDWVYAGLGYNTGASSRFEIGYLMQCLDRNKLHDTRNLHLLQLSWHTTVNLEELAIWYHSW